MWFCCHNFIPIWLPCLQKYVLQRSSSSKSSICLTHLSADSIHALLTSSLLLQGAVPHLKSHNLTAAVQNSSHISLLRKVRSSKSDFKIHWSHPCRSLRVQGLGDPAASDSRTVQGGIPVLHVGAITISGVAWVTPGGWVVSYPTRWSFTFILGPRHWSSIIYF